MRTALALLAAAYLPVVAVGCTKEEEEKKAEEEVSASAFLGADDFAPGKTNTTDKQDLGGELADNSAAYANDPSGNSLTLAGDDCIETALNAVVANASDHSIAIETTIDIGTCVQQMLAGAFDPDVDATTTVDVATLRLAFAAGCPEGDFSAYDGKTLKELEADGLDNICTAGSSRSFLTNLEMNFGATTAVKQEGQTATVKQMFRALSATAKSTGGACTDELSGDVWSLDGSCISVNRFINKEMTINGEPFGPQGVEDYVRLALNDLKMKNDKESPYFLSGSIDFRVNDWNGKITYTGPTTPPTYSASNGKESATGTLVGASLQRRASRLATKISSFSRKMAGTSY